MTTRVSGISAHSAFGVEASEAVGAFLEFDPVVFDRAFGDAFAAWPGTPAQRWWKWLVEAATAVGLRPKAIDASVAQARELTRRGVPLVTFVEGPDGGWLAVERFRRGRFVVSLRRQEVRLRPQALAERLGQTSVEDPVRWVAVEQLPPTRLAAAHAGPTGAGEHESAHGGHDQRGHGHEHAPPLSRLVALLRPERRDLWVVLIFALFSAVLSLATPIAVQALVDTVAFGRYLQPVVVLSLLLFTFLAFGAAMRGLQMYVAEIVQRRLFARVVSDLAFRLPRVRHDRDDGEHLPETVNRFFDVVTAQKSIALLLLDGASLVVAMLVGMAVLAVYDPWLFGFDLFLVALMAFSVFVLGRGAVRTSIRESRTKYATAAWIEDVARCRTAFALGGAGEFASHRLDRLTTEYLKARKSHFAVLMRQVGFALGLQAVAGTVLLGLGGWLVISNQLSLGQLVAAELIVAIIVGSFAKLGKHMEAFYDLMASVDKLGHLFDLPTEDPAGLLALPAGGAAALRCRGMAAGFAGRPDVFSGLDLDLSPGEAVALLAPAGGGKTLLADVLFGRRRPTHGYVEFDGVDPRDVRPDEYRSHVALAGRPEVVAGTIAENVGLDRPHVGSSEVREALRAVGVLESLLELPEGLKTVLTPDGAPLNETRTRLLMLARALAGRPRLLIIDGLLDGLDDAALDALAPVLGDPTRTTLVLTGRADVARRLPRIVRLSPGEPGSALAHLSRFRFDGTGRTPQASGGHS